MAKVFISYKHDVEPDEHLAKYFVDYFRDLHHEVFIDRLIEPGQNWSPAIQKALEEADFLIVLLSKYSVESDYVIFEVQIAHSRKNQYGSPTIFPVRVAYNIPFTKMPYNLGAMLSPIQFSTWQADSDEITIGEQLHQLMLKHQAQSEGSVLVQPDKVVVPATDGNPVQTEVKLVPPLPAFDPRWLKELDESGGVVQLESPFYVERQVDKEAKTLLLREGVTIRIKGCLQIGKTSLLARLYQHANDHNYLAVYIDFQEVDNDHFKYLETLLRYLADRIAYELNTNISPANFWQAPLSSKDKLTRFLQEVLKYTASPLVLIMDEVERIFTFEHYQDDFFSLLRSWHNKRAIIKPWRKLNLVLAYSHDTFLFITDQNQSPFNVGHEFILADFNRTQVEELNWKHGAPVKTTQEMDSIIELLQGHPFLIRKALYTLVIQKLSIDELVKQACNEDGPFSDHLHYYLLRFLKDQALGEAMKSVIWDHTCPNNLLFHQLLSNGLVRGTNHTNVQPRCGLYAQYFKTHL